MGGWAYFQTLNARDLRKKICLPRCLLRDLLEVQIGSLQFCLNKNKSFMSIVLENDSQTIIE